MKNEKITFVQIYSNSLFFCTRMLVIALIPFPSLLFEVLSWQFMQAIYAGLINCLQIHTNLTSNCLYI